MTDDDGARTKKGHPVHALCLEQARMAGARIQAPNNMQHSGPKKERAGLTASRPGRCPICMRLFGAGTPIGPCLDGQWGHASCAGAQQAAARNKAEILAGETYRSRRESTWRRGVSPGSSRRKT
ncbi:hypothetical protein [Pedococcus sp. 5OH_020]|uniref:hypothetical protein n=1 Tax=Pedococcus sp. 5OH_020 TaxID=2989814 RepID=UPI0022E9D0A5|nr:hypothetical protein [Pedococcus sp. 5OH_020]